MRKRPATHRAALRFLILFAAAGCVPHARLEVAPDLLSTQWSNSEVVLPSSRPGEPLAEATSLGEALASPELEALIARAREANADVRIAQARVRQARALFRSARGAMLPAVS